MGKQFQYEWMDTWMDGLMDPMRVNRKKLIE